MSKVTVFLIFTLIVTVVAGVGILVVRNIDGLVKERLEVVGSQVTGSRVRVASLKLDFIEGAGFFSGLTVANPRGYSDGNIFSIDSVSIDIDMGSLFENVYVIESISICGIRVLVEQAGSKNNIQTLLDIMRFEGEASSASSEKIDNEISLAVKEIIFRDTNVRIDSDLFGENSLTLPDFSLYDLGTPANGITSEQLAFDIAMGLAVKSKDGLARELRELAKREALSRIKWKIGGRSLESIGELKRLFNGEP